MRCGCCDKRLSSYEATLKHLETGEYLDTCIKCLDGLGIPILGNEELSEPEDSVEEYTPFNLDKFEEEE